MSIKKLSTGDKIFYAIDYFILALVMCVTLYPFVYVLSASVSASGPLGRGEVWLFPKGFTLASYKTVMQDNTIWLSYYNTIWYVVVGTTVNIFMTTITAYPLSRKGFSARNKIMMFIAFTMFFSGGLVPTYLLIRDLKLLNTRWAIIIPAAISTWNLIIMRTFLRVFPRVCMRQRP